MSRTKVVKRDWQYEMPESSYIQELPQGMGQVQSSGDFEELLNEAVEQADEIRRQAEEEAQRIIQGAHEETVNIMQQAEQAGYNEGYLRGLAEGGKAIEETAEDHLYEVKRLVELMQEERDEAIRNQEKDLIMIALEASKKIMRQHVDGKDDAIVKMIEEIIAENEDVLKVFLSEYHKSIDLHVDKSIAKKMKNYGKGLKTMIVSDEDTIMLETESGILDASIPTQLGMLKDAVENEIE